MNTMSTPVGSGMRSTSQRQRVHNIYKDPQSGMEFQMRPDQKLAPLVEDLNDSPEGMAVVILHYGDQEGALKTSLSNLVLVPKWLLSRRIDLTCRS